MTNSLLSQSSVALAKVDGTLIASETYALPSNAGSKVRFSSIPAIPAAIMAASAKYGFTSPPGTLFSKRSEWPDPTKRIAQVLLSLPHFIAVGAKDPST